MRKEVTNDYLCGTWCPGFDEKAWIKISWKSQPLNRSKFHLIYNNARQERKRPDFVPNKREQVLYDDHWLD